MILGPLVNVEWLSAHLEDVRVVDTRWYLDGRRGADAYAAGHIPGAVFLDVDTDLSAPASTREGRHPMPTPEAFATALGRVGIADGAPVVAYDDAGGSRAARLWWMLHVLDQPAAVLDGGLPAWLDAGEPLSTDEPAPTPVTREPRPWPAHRFVDADAVASSSSTVLDARAAERFAQGDPAIDPRPGHIPRAVSVPWETNLGSDGRYLPTALLRAKYPDGSYVAYCGSGVTACHNLLALTLAGRDDIALYPGSWSQWGNDPGRPAELG